MVENGVIFIKFSYDEWQFVKKYISGHNSRQRFLRNFDIILSKKLNKSNNSSCSIECINNYFKKPGSQKKESPFWSGNYKSSYSDCGKYKALIEEAPVDFQDVLIKILPFGIKEHLKLDKKTTDSWK